MNGAGRRLRLRSRLLRLTLIVLLLAVVSRVFYLQRVEGAHLSKQAASMWTESHTLPALRGTIYDRNFEKLAYTQKAYTVYVDPQQMKDASNRDQSSLVADRLAPILHVPVAQMSQLESLLSSNTKGWVMVAPWGNTINETQHHAIVSLINTMTAEFHAKGDDFTPGIYFDTTEQRVYPNGSFASHVLGFVNAQNQGGTGVEEEYQPALQGHDGAERYMSDLNGNPLPYGLDVVSPARDGQSIQLTIDSTIQHYVEVALDDAMKKFTPYRASIIVTNPATGEILAMGSRPTYDPNNYAQISDPSILYQNWAINSTFEPGSTFKIVTLTAALSENKINLSDTYDSSPMTVGSALVHDWNWTGFGRITFHDAFVKSSNVGFTQIALKLGAPLLYKYVDAFGFDSPTGIDLPAEASSLLFPVATIRPIELATTGYGQGISVTPIQQVAAVGAVANGGQLMRPYVVKSIINSDTGKTISTTKPIVRRSVASPEVMSQMRSVMEDEVNQDTNLAAFIPGYDVAGKTGTASIPKKGGGYYDSQNRYITSFIGFAPASHPIVEIYVTVDTPKVDVAFGSTVAAPLAKQVLAQTLPYLHAPVDQAQLDAYLKKGGAAGAGGASGGKQRAASHVQYATVPNLIDATQDTAQSTAKAANITLETVGQGTRVTHQWPEHDQDVVAGSRVLAIFGDGKASSGEVAIPDLTGFSMREATNILMELGMKVSVSGDGYVITQSVAAGKMVLPGTSVSLSCASP